MKPQQFNKNNKLSIDKKTIARLDQSSLSSLNGGNEAAGTTATSVTVTSFVPTTQTSTATTVTTIY
jgi:hypothetical protein